MKPLKKTLGSPEIRIDKKPTEKEIWKPGTMLNPVPAVLVSCGNFQEKKMNLITVAWAGTVCSDPPMVSISVRRQRFSYDMIAESKEFVINLASIDMARMVDFCGVHSGREMDKFKEARLTPVAASQVMAPLVAESPVNLECRVRKIIKLGSHDMFLAEVVAVQVQKELVDFNGKLHLEKAKLLAYSHGHYYSLGRMLGEFGFSTKRQRRIRYRDIIR